MNREEEYINSVTYSDVARAISRDLSRVFCVNTETDYFVEFIPDETDEALDIRTSGADFKSIVHSFEDTVFPPDLDTFRAAVSKQNILKVLNDDDSFSLTCRMMMDNKPLYIRIKATRLRRDDPSHILIGLTNTDAHMQRLAIYERAMSRQLTFTAVSEALSADYDCILYANTQSGEYVEYSSSERYKRLGLAQSGDDFFELCSKEFSGYIYEEDRDVFLRALDKDNLLKVLSQDRVFLLTFRVCLSNTPVYYRVKITKMNRIDDHHIVVGLSNIDSNVQRAQQYEQMKAIANRDSLTGVRSKHAFTEDEALIDREIRLDGTAPFAIVVCDVNGLKKINDTQGHKAGDDYLLRSCRMVCEIFSHSPVYRIGGDEFVVLLRGNDYTNRMDLMQQLHRLSAAHIGSDEAVVSGGLAEYDPDQDHCFRDTFERADAAMYREKILLKSQGAPVRDSEAEEAGQSTEDIPIINLRRHILIADDQEANRGILGALLESDYDLLYASDGVETMEMIHKYKDEIALVILDLYMPKMDGREVLSKMQVDEELMSIPVIMLTVDREAELDSLKLGAADFISKPYPDIDIVKARIAKCIELSEDRDLIRHTQRDKLTGLLNYDYFIQYLNRFDHLYSDRACDAFVCDIVDFRSVNEKYGRQFGDLVLRSIGASLRKLARKTGGIGCRKDGDIFMLYCPHQDNFEQLVKAFQKNLFIDKETAGRISLSFGIFKNASQEPDIEERFVRARIAADGCDHPDGICEVRFSH